jgi:hypothetical protein
LTLGGSFDDFEQSPFEQSQFNPKIGAAWDINGRVRLRAAVLRTLSRIRSLNQTLEPTEVAGFNQFFDDFQGTDAWQYSIGLDAKVFSSVFAGFDYSVRRLDGPAFRLRTEEVDTVDQHEDLGKVFVYWVPTNRIAVRGALEYERFKQLAGDIVPFDREAEAWLVPLSAAWFDPSGFFAELQASYVHQDVSASDQSPFPQGDDSFIVVDSLLGYRLPRRRGALSIGVANLLDNGFSYQDVNFRTSETFNPRFIPERTIIGRLTLSF